MTDPKDIDREEEVDSSPSAEQDDSNGEEEIYSNRPAVPNDTEDDFLTDSEDEIAEELLESEAEGQEEVKRPEVRMRPKTVEELLLDAVPQRAKAAGDKLKMHLAGKIVIAIRNSSQRYLLDWTGNEMITAPAQGDEADCTITLTESDLMKVSTGELNPQILMLSHKVHVAGKSDHAMYVFNLIAPRSSL